MAGLRMSVVVSATAFLLGASRGLASHFAVVPAGHVLTCRNVVGLLFTHWIADSLTLWKSPETQSDARLWTAASYYSILTRMPPVLFYVYSSVAIVGGATLFWSLGDLRAGNLMFDGGSIREYSYTSLWGKI